MPDVLLPEVRASIQAGIFRARVLQSGRIALEYVSPRVSQLLGIPGELLLEDAQRAFDLIHPDDRETFWSSFGAAAKSRNPYFWQGRAIIGGHEHWMQIESAPILDCGQDTIWSGILVDLTAQRDAERSLAASHQRLQEILDFLPDPTFAIDREGRVIVWNRAIEQMTSANRSAVLGKGDHEYALAFYGERRPMVIDLVFGDREEIRCRYNKVARSGDSWWAQLHLPKLQSRSDVYLWGKASPLLDANGQIVGAIESIRDMTEHEMATIALRESEERFRKLFDHSADPVLLECDGRFIDCNAAALTLMHAQSKQQLIGLTPADTAAAHQPDGRPSAVLAREYLEKALKEGSCRFEWLSRTLDGHEFPIEILLTPIPVNGKTVVHVVGRDITQRKRAEAERNELLAREKMLRKAAETASKTKDEFLAVLSHELRTPLTPVLLSLASWQENKVLPPELRNELDMLLRNLQMERVLIDDLLDLTHVSKGTLRIEKRPVDLHQIIREAVGICESVPGAPFRLDLTPGPLLANVDPDRIRQVFWNLLNNARKFTPASGQIVIRTQRPAGGHWGIVIMDDGVGIDPAFLPRLFDPFMQGKIAGARPRGLGLGLAISKAIVEAHGGTIAASSDGIGRGATFTLRLPGEPATPRDLAPGATAGATAPAATQQPCRVLLVEDHADTARLLTIVLRKAGYAVTAAGSLASALELGTRGEFDLLVSDLGLPDGSGHDVMRQLRQRHPRLRGVAVSGYGASQDISNSLAAGFAEHLVKPITPAKLLETLTRLTASMPSLT